MFFLFRLITAHFTCYGSCLSPNQATCFQALFPDIVSYAYVGSRVGQRVYDDTDASGSNDVTYTINYDDYGRADRHYTYQNTTDIVDFGYSYDNNSNIVEISFDHRPTTPDNSFTYDDLNRLTGVEYLSDTSDTESFTMDDLGNRTSATLRGDTSATSYAVNDLTNRYDETGTFDVTLGYDNAGNTTSDGTYGYFYDYENRLIRIEDSSGLRVKSYEYDALGRRIQMATDDETIKYYYNAQWQVLFDDSYSDNYDMLYVYGNYIDEPLFMRNVVYGEDFYYAHNHLFSTVALLGDDGHPVERYEYDAYGAVTVYTNMSNWSGSTPYTLSWSPTGNPYVFTGRRFDTIDESGPRLMDYRHRTYNPQLGRFMQHDPLGYIDGMSLYEYVMSSPNIYTDAFGLSCESECELGDFDYEILGSSVVPYQNPIVDLDKYFHKLHLASEGITMAHFADIVAAFAMGLGPAEVAAKFSELALTEILAKSIMNAIHPLLENMLEKEVNMYLKLEPWNCEEKRCGLLWCSKANKWVSDSDNIKYYKCTTGSIDFGGGLIGTYRNLGDALSNYDACTIEFTDKLMTIEEKWGDDFDSAKEELEELFGFR